MTSAATPGAGGGTKRVLLHVGTPKTGTSFLQDVLFRNREVLSEHGIAYPAERFDEHFLAALDLMRLPWGGLEESSWPRWDSLAERVVEAEESTVIVSHEILAHATRHQAAQAIEDLSYDEHGREVEIHLVLSVRDLVRQIPAEWQENVKHRSEISYARFLRGLQDPARTGRVASWFWRVQEIPDILHRWGAQLPPERVHLITVPPPGAPRELLWQRFSATFGLDGLPLDLTAERANVSLGVPETQLHRRVNTATRHELAPEAHRELVLELLAHRTLSQRTGSPRLALPPALWPWVSELTERWIAVLDAAGYDVVGDLADLRGRRPRRYVDPDAALPEQALEAATQAITALAEEGARLRSREAELAEELSRTREELQRARVSVPRKAAERVVGRLESSDPGRRALGLYRRARGRA